MFFEPVPTPLYDDVRAPEGTTLTFSTGQLCPETPKVLLDVRLHSNTLRLEHTRDCIRTFYYLYEFCVRSLTTDVSDSR